MNDWAENECRIACKKENPNFDFDGDDFDYGCSCFKSALKAYKSLCEDGHSGGSFSFTKNILIRLLEHLPLTPITDDDFAVDEHNVGQTPEYLQERGLKSDVQCPRMSSIFRMETLDGKVSYHDIDRAYSIDIENPSNTYFSSTSIIDELFPITMPYYPSKSKYKIYEQSFLVNKINGDFDTRAILYVVTPDGERIDVNRYKTTDENGNWKDITKEEYDKLLAKRLDPLSVKVSESLLWTLIDNSSDDEEVERRRDLYGQIPDKIKDKWLCDLEKMCMFFDNPDHYQYNTFEMEQALCRGDKSKYESIPELVDIAEYLGCVLSYMNTKDCGCF